MLKHIRNLFTKEDVAGDEDQVEHDEAIAAALVLLEVAWADHEIEQRELETIRHALADLYQIDNDEIDFVMEQARTKHEESTDLYSFTKQLNEHLEREEKQRLLQHLWCMNTFDESDFHYEEYMIRRIADLLYCSHEEFIAAKLFAKQKAVKKPVLSSKD